MLLLLCDLLLLQSLAVLVKRRALGCREPGQPAGPRVGSGLRLVSGPHCACVAATAVSAHLSSGSSSPSSGPAVIAGVHERGAKEMQQRGCRVKLEAATKLDPTTKAAMRDMAGNGCAIGEVGEVSLLRLSSMNRFTRTLFSIFTASCPWRRGPYRAGAAPPPRTSPSPSRPPPSPRARLECVGKAKTRL